MRIFITILLILIVTTGSINKPDGCLQMDIMLLGDFSTSVCGYESFVANSFESFAKKFELSETGTKIGVASFADGAILICPLTSDQLLFKAKVDSMQSKRCGGGTNMYAALTLALDQFAKHGRPTYRKIIIVVSDGEPNDSNDVLTIGSQIKALNIGICGVLVVKRVVPKESDGWYGMWTISTYTGRGGDFMKQLSSNYCYVESDYENLISELKKLDICL